MLTPPSPREAGESRFIGLEIDVGYLELVKAGSALRGGTFVLRLK